MIGQDDAASALEQIARTRRRAGELRGYAHAGDIVAGWGLVWLACNLLSYAAPRWGAMSWPVGIVIGVLWSVVRGRAAGERPGWRVFASAAAMVGFLMLVSAIAGVRNPDQANAMISLFVAASYIVMGIWTGARYAWIGLAIAGFVCMGWFVDRAHLELWLGIGGGGALLLTGLWLRRA